MPCYHPLIRVEDNSRWETAKDGHKYRPAKIISCDKDWTQPDTEKAAVNLYVDNPGKVDLIPCGKCIGCRLEYSRQWANRGYLESKHYKENYFVTITYDNEHIPKREFDIDEDGCVYYDDGTWNGTLYDKDLQQFIKNIRQKMQRRYKKDLKTWKEKASKRDPKTPKKPKKPCIRFMACGEYGELHQRPHYHIIFFNLKIPVDDLYNPKIIGNEYGCKNIYYQSHIIEECWGKGISNISEASWNNIAYTARYITKKVNGPTSSAQYAAAGQDKEFFRMSRMPGIGETYYRAHKKEIYKTDEIIINNLEGAISCKPPKYFDRLLEKENPELMEQIKQERRKTAEQNAKIKDLNTSIDRLSQLEIDERKKLDQSAKLIREMEKKAGI